MPIRAKNFAALAAGCAAIIVAAATASAQCGPPGENEPALRESLLVTVPWLAQHLHDPHLVVLHVEMHMGRMNGPRDYDTGHIPGARFASAHDLDASPDSVARLLSALGVTSADRVVFYGNTWMNGRAFLALTSVGLSAALLDGGLEAWRAANQPVETAPARVTRSVFRARPAQDVTVDRAWVAAHLRDPAVTILDGRSTEEYVGGNPMNQLKRPGHIPGAILFPWAATFTDSTTAEHGHMVPVKSVRELRAMMRVAGVAPGKTVVVYCTVGMRASHLLWLLRYLGYDARIYNGSMADWSDNSTLPVVTGNSRGAP